MDPHILAEFNNRIAGEVVVPGSKAYDELRNVFNQAGSPAVIVRGNSNDDIVMALRFAREHHLPLSVRSGGHGLSGQATNNGGLVLDLTPTPAWQASKRPMTPTTSSTKTRTSSLRQRLKLERQIR